jgi:hypothetical protein
MGGPKNKGYKRSWKNLLLNKRYQLRFTLFMVGLSALLMGVLGWWVNKEAKKATTIFLNNVQVCPQTPPLVSGGGEPSGAAVDTSETVPVPEEAPAPAEGAEESAPKGAEEPAPKGAEEPAPKGAEEPAPEETDRRPPGAEPAPAGALGSGETEGGAGEQERPRRVVDVTTSEMTMQKRVTSDFVHRALKAHTCRMAQVAERDALYAGQQLILYVMVVVGAVLLIGLTLYGIKMTHRVAGPLFKVTLYFKKMKEGKYDMVYPLRKGDYLGEFYQHFKAAHAGLRKTEEEDVEELKAAIAMAEKEDLASKSPEIAAALGEMKATLKRKEEGLV